MEIPEWAWHKIVPSPFFVYMENRLDFKAGCRIAIAGRRPGGIKDRIFGKIKSRIKKALRLMEAGSAWNPKESLKTNGKNMPDI